MILQPAVPSSRGFLLLLAGLLLSAAVLAVQSPAETKPAVPNEAELERAMKGLQFLHGPALQKAAGDRTAQLQLAVTLFELAETAQPGSAERFVWYRQAAELGASAGDINTALYVARALDQHFDFDAEALLGKLLEAALKACQDDEELKVFVNILREEMEQAVTADKYGWAVKLGESAQQAALKTKSQPLMQQVSQAQKAVDLARQKYAAVQPFFEKLEKEGADAEANGKVGAYLCLEKGEWERGLFLLAQGTDAALRLQAQRDLLRPKEARAQAELGDSWWELAKKYEGRAAVHLHRRAVYWYEQAVHELDGALRERAEERITLLLPRPRQAAWDHFGPPGLVRVIDSHQTGFYFVAMSPDGKQVVANRGFTSTVWDVNTGKMVFSLKPDLTRAADAAWSPKGTHFFTTGHPGATGATVRMWDSKTGKEVMEFLTPRASAGKIDVSFDGRRLITASSDGTVRIWDIQTGKELMELINQRNEVFGVVFSPDSRFALSCLHDGNTFIYWDLKTGKKLHQLKSKDGSPPGSLAISPDGRFAAALSWRRMTLWDLKTGQEVRTFKREKEEVIGHVGAFSPDGRRLITAGDKTICYWDVATGKLLHEFHNDVSIRSLAVSPGGGRIVTGDAHSLRLWGLPRK